METYTYSERVMDGQGRSLTNDVVVRRCGNSMRSSKKYDLAVKRGEELRLSSSEKPCSLETLLSNVRTLTRVQKDTKKLTSTNCQKFNVCTWVRV